MRHKHIDGLGALRDALLGKGLLDDVLCNAFIWKERDHLESSCLKLENGGLFRSLRHWHIDCLLHGALSGALLWDALDDFKVLLQELRHGAVVDFLEDAPDALLESGLDHLRDVRRDLRAAHEFFPERHHRCQY